MQLLVQLYDEGVNAISQLRSVCLQCSGNLNATGANSIQIEVAGLVAKKILSVRETEHWLRRIIAPHSTDSPSAPPVTRIFSVWRRIGR